MPVKVSPHRSLNVSRGVIRSRDIASCSVEEIVEELRPQGVTAAVIIHARDGDSKRRTNTVILTFASPQPPKHITAGYMRVPVDPYIPNPLRCFNCQKYGHSSRACKNSAACVKCGRLATKEQAVVTKNCALTAKANMLRLLENAQNASLKIGCNSFLLYGVRLHHFFQIHV